jgi:hypothetical protein
MDPCGRTVRGRYLLPVSVYGSERLKISRIHAARDIDTSDSQFAYCILHSPDALFMLV